MRRLVEYARDPRRAAWIGFWWGLAEGTFFFVVPDVWIGLATMYSLASGVAAWGASIFGTFLAAGVLWVGVRFGLVPPMLLWIPGIPATMVDRVTAQIAAGGLPWDPALIVGGVPFKLYAVVFLAANRPFAALLLWVVMGRLRAHRADRPDCSRRRRAAHAVARVHRTTISALDNALRVVLDSVLFLIMVAPIGLTAAPG